MGHFSMSIANALDGQLRITQNRQRRAAAFAPPSYESTLRVIPTCPPGQSVRVFGGRIYAGYNWGAAAFDDYEQRAYTVPDLMADLADPDSVTVEVSFSIANRYQFFLLELKLPAIVEEPAESDWSFYLHGTGDELATAGEAEQWLNSYDFQHSSPWDEGAYGLCFPLCGIVLRNDGRTGLAGAFLPIDMINRGRSYLWPRDMRPRWYIES